jgi:ring-1,2-phenylacetyl-CoA epoxidase subunit PaaC
MRRLFLNSFYMQSKIDYILHLADNALILGHRNSEWCGHGPVLEQDIAISNIALDLIGQARMLYQHATELINNNSSDSFSLSSIIFHLSSEDIVSEDTLAYRRDVPEYKNCLLAEQPNGDWAITILRQFFISVYQHLLYTQLQQSNDAQLAAIATKSLKEVTYHVKWSSEWVIRLGDGTEESHRRMRHAIQELWPFTGELFESTPYERTGAAEGWGTAMETAHAAWLQKVTAIFDEARLEVPQAQSWYQSGGKTGLHSEYLGFILAEMQFLQRAYPGSEW